MKSNLPQRSRRKGQNLVIFSELGIPVFLVSDFIPDGLQGLAPDDVNWIQSGAVENTPDKKRPSQKKYMHHKTDSEIPSGPG